MHSHQEVFEVRVAQRGWKEQLNMLSSGLILFTQAQFADITQSDLTCFTLLFLSPFSELLHLWQRLTSKEPDEGIFILAGKTHASILSAFVPYCCTVFPNVRLLQTPHRQRKGFVTSSSLFQRRKKFCLDEVLRTNCESSQTPRL